MIQKRAIFARKQGCDKLGIGEGRAIDHEAFFDFKKFPQPVGETALQPAAFVATKPWRTPRFGEVKMKKRKWKQAPLGGACKGRWKVLIRSYKAADSSYGVLTTRKPSP